MSMPKRFRNWTHPQRVGPTRVDAASLERPWVDWERIAIAKCPNSEWCDLPDGTIDWSGQGRLELRRLRCPQGIILEGRPVRDGQ
jgi:hypothetical protein